MRKSVDEETFLDHLMQTHWFKETIDLYFNSEYRLKYDAIMQDFHNRGTVKEQGGQIYTTVKV
jgi:hypothetical protein